MKIINSKGKLKRKIFVISRKVRGKKFYIHFLFSILFEIFYIHK